MDAIIIKHNPLRLLAQAFMHLEPRLTAASVLREGGKYNIEHIDYGKLGQVELIKMYECPLYDLKDTVSLLSIGIISAKDMLKAEGVSNMTGIQCCVFRFVRRNDNAFKELIDCELKRAGISITRQAQLL